MNRRTLNRAVARMRREAIMRDTLRRLPAATAAQLHDYHAAHGTLCAYCTADPARPDSDYCSDRCAIGAAHD